MAKAAAAEFADGAVFVPLAAISDPSLVFPAIARALDVRETPERPLIDSLIDALRDRRLLLVLDNFEHVLAAAFDLARLLAACPRLTILVSSRAALRLSGEQLFLTPPLALPAPDERPALEDLAAAEAVALFVLRARLVSPDLVLDADNALAIAEICRRLDGLPLAIELAAAWVRVLPPAALLARLEQRLPLLRGGAADQPVRLRTMRDAIAWSYDLLTAEEAQLFRRLAVFVGGFSLEAAEWVPGTGCMFWIRLTTYPAPICNPQPITRNPRRSTSSSPSSTRACCSRRTWTEREPRYQMLETVREFGLERLAESGEAEAIAARHAMWCVSLTDQVRRTGRPFPQARSAHARGRAPQPAGGADLVVGARRGDDRPAPGGTVG